MNAGVTFERVYRAIKDQILAGRFAPGAHLEPAALAPELNASITPVRDALHRLAGEGLVDTPRGEGFRIPQVTEVGLRQLYRWNAALLDLAVKARTAGSASDFPESAPAGILERTEHLFARLAAGTANSEHLAATVRLNERLRPVRHAELGVLEDAEAELVTLERHAAQSDVRLLRRALAAYHRRRERLVGELVAHLLTPR